ncbi:MAG: polyprenyl synthetase family protein, partial [Candidatus Puniceispirillaceae bacterium]
MENFLAQLREDAAACETHIKALLAAVPEPAAQLHEAMAYAVLNGGKRMRAALVFGAARMAVGQDADAAPSEAML